MFLKFAFFLNVFKRFIQVDIDTTNSFVSTVGEYYIAGIYYKLFNLLLMTQSCNVHVSRGISGL